MIAGDRINRLRKSLKWKIEIGFIVLHGPRRINDVRGHDEELHVIAQPECQIARNQRILRSVALAGIADDEEAEITGSIDAVGADAEKLVAVAAVSSGLRVDHADSPGVDPQFRHLLIDACRPTFRVEVPAKAPDRVEGDKKRGHRQA